MHSTFTMLTSIEVKNLLDKSLSSFGCKGEWVIVKLLSVRKTVSIKIMEGYTASNNVTYKIASV